jgi:hypothetical protein
MSVTRSLKRLLRRFSGKRKRGKGRDKPHGDFRCLKAWPAALADAEGLVTFAIPLKSRRSTDDWRITQNLLAATLRSVLRQSDPRFRVIICGHDAPEDVDLSDDRIEFLEVGWKTPSHLNEYMRDRNRKRFAMGQRLRGLRGGYFMSLDADDLIHRDIAAYALGTAFGCVAAQGYVYDLGNARIAPVPGAWSVDLDRLCGSTAIVRYEPSEIPEKFESGAAAGAFSFSRGHTYLRAVHDSLRRPLAAVPFPSVVYVINTTDNHSLASKPELTAGTLQNIREHMITSVEALRGIDDAFGTSLAAAD